MKYVKYLNILRSIFRRKTSTAVLNKIVDRFDKRNSKEAIEQARKWCDMEAVEITDYLNTFPANILEEANQFIKELKVRENKVQSSVPFKMGAGGNCMLIYCLARYRNAKTIVETGVSMGYSSFTFLKVLEENGGGKLLSSDLPYFDHPDAEKYIGCIIPDELKKDWIIYLDGDQANFPRIAKQIGNIDILNYDSAKSYQSRVYAWKYFKQFFKSGTMIMYDDIIDNLHFRDLVLRANLEFKVIKGYTGNYVGLIFI